MPALALWLSAIFAAWLAWAAFCAWLLARQPRAKPALQEGPLLALALALVRLYARLVHRARADGLANVPSGPAPFLLVSNHTAGVDPIIIQAFLRREVTWMMGRDMMLPRFHTIWTLLRIIPVEREGTGKAGRDPAALRRAVRSLRQGDIVGIFPEGHIPAHGLGPFSAGVGLLVQLGACPVLPVRISGTPRRDRAWKSLLAPSRSRVRFFPLMHFDRDCPPDEVTRRIRDLYLSSP